MALRPKLSSESYRVPFNFVGRIPANTTLSTAAVVCTVVTGEDSSPSSVVGSPVVSGTTVSIPVAGGVPGVVYNISVRATLANGQVLEMHDYMAVYHSGTTPGAVTPFTFTVCSQISGLEAGYSSGKMGFLSDLTSAQVIILKFVRTPDKIIFEARYNDNFVPLPVDALTTLQVLIDGVVTSILFSAAVSEIRQTRSGRYYTHWEWPIASLPEFIGDSCHGTGMAFGGGAGMSPVLPGISGTISLISAQDPYPPFVDGTGIFYTIVDNPPVLLAGTFVSNTTGLEIIEVYIQRFGGIPGQVVIQLRGNQELFQDAFTSVNVNGQQTVLSANATNFFSAEDFGPGVWDTLWDIPVAAGTNWTNGTPRFVTFTP